MKREYLKELGIEEEAINNIMAENGKDVEKAKTELITKETELKTLQGQLEQANTQIESFKGLDIEGIKKASDDYKKQYEDTKTKAEKDIADIKFNHDLESMARDYKAKNVKAVLALLDKEALKGSSNRDSDLKTAFEGLNTSDGYLFGSDEANGTGGSLGAGNKGKKTMTKENIMAIENSIDRKQKIAENIELFK